MIQKNKANEVHGRMLLEEMSERQIELLHELEQIEYNGLVYDTEEIKAHYLALIAEMAEVFETNDDGQLLDPRDGRPISDLRDVSEHDDPPEHAGLVDEELEALIE